MRGYGYGCALLATMFTACGSVSDDPIDAAVSVDGSIDGAIDGTPPPCNLAAAFGAPMALTEVNSAGREINATLSPDELTLYVASTRGGGPGGFDLHQSTRANRSQPFSTPQVLANVNTASNEEGPAVTGDGLTLFVASNRGGTGSTGAFDLMVASRTSTAADFGAMQFVSTVNAAGEDSNPYVTDDGLNLYFASERNATAARYYVATRSSTTAPFGPPVEFSSLPAGDGRPTFSADGLTMYFDRVTGAASSAIFVSRRSTTQDGFGTGTRVTELDNTGYNYPLFLSRDGCRLYLVSNGTGTAGAEDIWMAAKPSS